MTSWLLRHFIGLVAAVALAAYVLVQAVPLGPAPIHADGYSYYVYLPSWFLYRDATLESVARDCCGGTYPAFTAITRWASTGQWVNPHPIGVAILMAPAFLVAHGLTRWSNMPVNGFSLYYQHAAGLSAIAALLVGLAVLRRVLRPRVGEGVTLATLTTLTFGTNLFHYAVYDGTYSHVFSFALIAGLVAVTERWWNQPGTASSVGLGLLAGLVVLVRHPNAVYLLLVPLYGASELGRVGALRALLSRRAAVAQVFLAGAVVVAPQLWLYHQATGRWLLSAYGQVGGFDFLAPHVAGVIVGVTKGLFFWSPLLLLAVAGVAVAPEWACRWRLGAAVIFVLETWLIASWWDWQFGGSFGHRGFTDGLALAALFLASALAWASQTALRRRVVGGLSAACVLLSLAQMTQYWMGILPMSDTTWAQYRALFLHFR